MIFKTYKEFHKECGSCGRDGQRTCSDIWNASREYPKEQIKKAIKVLETEACISEAIKILEEALEAME